LGQPVVVVNKPGGGSSIGYRELYNAKPDGYTIGYGMATIITNKMQGILPFDYRAFKIIGGFYRGANPIIVSSTKTKRPFKTMQEVLAFAKSNPGEVSIATGAVGQSWWIATMAFVEASGLKFNVVPQAGSGGFSLMQVSGGHTDLAAIALTAGKAHIDSGSINFLAGFGEQRPAPPYSNVPTLRELGIDVVYESIGAIMVPLKTPQEAEEKLTKAFHKAASDPEYQKFMADRYQTPIAYTPEEMVKLMDGQRDFYRKILAKTGILKDRD
jgi:tripartite-type tricarboxylate transporter receptor subunit TctC